MRFSITTTAVLVGALALAPTFGHAQVGDATGQNTATSQVELKRWFLEPSQIDEVIRTSDETNFLKAASFAPQSGSRNLQPPTPPAASPGSTLPLPPVAPQTDPPQVPAEILPTPPSPIAEGHTVPSPTTVPPVQSRPVPSLPAYPGTTQSATPQVDSATASPASAQPSFINNAYPMPSQFNAGAGCSTGQCGTPTCGGQCGTSCRRSPPSLCDRGCRNWTISTGALFLFRSRPNRQPLVFDPLGSGQAIDGSNFSFGLQTGFEGTAIRHRAFGDWDFETKYFGIEDWSALQSQRFDGNPIGISNTPPTFVSGPRQVTSRYSSDIHNFEWNLKKPVGNGMNFLIGVRHLQLNEKLNTRFTSLLTPPISTEDYRINTTNRLYGLQAGFSKALCSDCAYCLEVYGKAGVFANDSEQRSSLVNFLDTGVVEFGMNDRDTQLAFIGEIGLRYTYNLCDNVNFVTGYRGLWVDGVTLASDQVPSTNFAGISSNIDNSGEVFYHGATAGVEFRF